MGGRSLKILLVDDDEGVRDMLMYFLESWGHRVREARDGSEALAYLASDEARGLDLVITDQRMPGVLGEVVVRAAKQLVGCKVILMSGEVKRLQEVGMAAGADLVLPKPFDVEVVLKRAIAELFTDPR